MALAQIGPLTSLLENAAAAIGAGMLLGSFAAGLPAFLLGWPRQRLETEAAKCGFAGGAASVAIIVTDITLRYA